jgi:hypothetical protein
MFINDYGTRKCKICGRFLPRFVLNECVCSCGAFYQSEWSMSR